MWRPKNWAKCPCDGCPDKVVDEYGCVCDFSCGEYSMWINYEFGADDMLEAVKARLKEGSSETMDYMHCHGDYLRWIKEIFGDKP